MMTSCPNHQIQKTQICQKIAQFVILDSMSLFKCALLNVALMPEVCYWREYLSPFYHIGLLRPVWAEMIPIFWKGLK